MDSAAERYLGIKTIHYEDVAGKGAKQIPFSQVDVERAAEYAAEDADVTLRLHRVLWPQLEAVPALARALRNDRAAARAGSAAHGAHRRARRPRPAEVAERRVRRAHARNRVARARAGGRRVQPGLAEAAPGDPVRQARHTRDPQDADRPAVDRRGRARRTRGGPCAAEIDLGLPRRRETQIHLHRQACRSRSILRRDASIRPITRRSPRPAACRRRIRTCRTFRFARRKDAVSARRSSRRRDIRSSPRIIRKSNCGSWRTCPAIRASCARSPKTATSTARPRRRCSASPRMRSPRISAAPRRRSISA